MPSFQNRIHQLDPKSQNFEFAKDFLELVDLLATSKTRELKQGINSLLQANLNFKITILERSQDGTSITPTDDVENAANLVRHIIDGSCAGASETTKKAVDGILSSALTALLCGEVGQEVYQQSCVAIAENRLLVRIDVAFWSYGIAANRVAEKPQTAIAYVCVKSLIDAKAVQTTELESMYQKAAILAQTPGSKQNILDALDEAKKTLLALK